MYGVGAYGKIVLNEGGEDATTDYILRMGYLLTKSIAYP
jgi:hypothetical protein